MKFLCLRPLAEDQLGLADETVGGLVGDDAAPGPAPHGLPDLPLEAAIVPDLEIGRPGLSGAK